MLGLVVSPPLCVGLGAFCSGLPSAGGGGPGDTRPAGGAGSGIGANLLLPGVGRGMG